jgi:SAM-dependent methyltransferase
MSEITEASVKAYLDTFAEFRQPEQQGYLATAVDRFTRTLRELPRLPDPGSVRLLEIGGRPYFMTVLIRHFLGYSVYAANEPTPVKGEEDNVARLVNDAGEVHEIPLQRLNIEYDAWPWADDFFDIVLYCEVIEHLVYDPTHTLVETHRVLKSDTGKLLLSTPNALVYTALLDMIRGRNFFPPYDGYSHYARHHRLFSPAELRHLCTKIGFEVHHSYSAYDTAYAHPRRLERLVQLLIRRGRLTQRLDVIYLLATPHGEPRYAYPSQAPYLLYQDVHGYGRIESGTFRMADDLPQLGGGFYGFEDWGGGIRWSAGQGRLFLKQRDERELELTFFSGPRPGDAQVRGWVEMSSAAGSERHGFTVPSSSWETLRLPLPPAEDGGGKLNILIEVANPLVPFELDPANPDRRALGVALREAALV